MRARVTTRTRRGAVEVVVYWRDHLGGRHVRFFGQDREAAEKFRAHVDGPLPTEAHAPTVATWAKRWLERIDALVGAGQLRPPTAANYRTTIERKVAGHWLGQRPLEELHRRDVKAWLQGLLTAGLAATTVRLHAAALRVCLAEAIEEGLLRPPNPAAGIIRAMRLPGRSEPPLAPDVAVTAALLDAMPPAPRFACSVILGLGLRLGEACGLQWADLELGAATAQVVRQVYEDGSVVGLKSRAGRRSVDVPEWLVAELVAERARAGAAALAAGNSPSPWVLGVAPEDSGAARQRWAFALKRAAKRTGYSGRVWIHGLRHTHAVGKLEEGADLDVLKRGMGHSSIRLTADLYGAHAKRRDKGAADRFGDRIRVRQGRLFGGPKIKP